MPPAGAAARLHSMETGMALSAAEIEAVVADLKPKLEGGRIERIDQPAPDRLILHVRMEAQRYWLLICAHLRFSRLHLLTRRPEEGTPATGFCNVVRQHMTATPILTLRHTPGDRIVTIEAQGWDRLMRPRPVSLVAELTGVGSNMLVVDESGRVLGAQRRVKSAQREIAPGLPYKPPPCPKAPPASARVNRFEAACDPDDPLSLSRAIEAHYAGLEASERVENARRKIERAVGRELKRARRRLAKVTEQLATAQGAEAIRRQGELLKIAMPDIERGSREVTVEDLFDPETPMITIKLDPSLSPQQNLEKIFKRYTKLKAGREKLTVRAEDTRERLEALQRLQQAAAAADSDEEFAALRQQAQGAGIRFPEDGPVVRRGKRAAGPRMFTTTDGFEILVARNRRENDRLTFTIARGNDYWMHVLGWPGPHVVIRMPAGRELSQQALLDAAHLAVHYSKIRSTDFAQVAYTRVKHVNRVKGDEPGRVRYADAKTLSVRFSRDRLDRIMKKPAAEDVP